MRSQRFKGLTVFKGLENLRGGCWLQGEVWRVLGLANGRSYGHKKN